MFVVIFLLLLGTFSLDVLSSARAYVGGESLWSKAQKDSVHYLNQYARTHDAQNYQKFQQAIAVTLGDHKARVALQQPVPDEDAAYQGFVEGKNDADDIPGMIRLFRRFHATSLMQRSVEVWTRADLQIDELNSLAQQLHDYISAGQPEQAAVENLLYRINAINDRLTLLEQDFSAALGEASRNSRWLIVAVMLLIAPLLLALGMLLSRRMVVRSVAAANALQQNELRLRTMVDTAMDAVVEMDNHGLVIGWSGQAERIFGWSSAEMLGKPLHEMIIPPHLRSKHLAGLRRIILEGAGPTHNRRMEVTGLRRDGSEFPVELTISQVRWQGRNEFCAFVRDITERKRVESQLQQLAHFDAITGLPNRVLFHDRLEQEMKKAYRSSLPLALMFLDIDRFKEVNDTMGHDKGDILLAEAARRLHACVRETDTVARLGGDEFTVILSQIEDIGSIERVAGNILQRLSEPFTLGEELAYVSISIGITLYPADAVTRDELIKNADQAMYLAKKTGRNRFNYFTPAMQQAAQNFMRIATDLRSAIAEDQLRVYYQPILKLTTGEIHKAEALIRWQHPQRGLVSPAEFIQIAEETGLIIEIGDWVFCQVAQQVAQWRGRYHKEFQVSVNKSPAQFLNVHDHVSWVAELKKHGLPGRAVVVEITEGMLMEVSQATQAKLLEFRDAGIQVALDDFGTGYSSLSYLSKFDIDYIKIDQSFVRNLGTDTDEIALCEAMIVMAHKLGMQVIAEGVETEMQRELLLAAGCDYAQGYLFSRPVPVDAFEALLNQRVALTGA